MDLPRLVAVAGSGVGGLTRSIQAPESCCVFKFSTSDTPTTSATTATLSAKIMIEQSSVDRGFRFAADDRKGGPWVTGDVGDTAGPS